MTKQSLLACLAIVVVAVSRGQGGLDMGHRIGLDAFVFCTAHFYRFEEGGLSRNEAVLERVAAPVGCTGRISSVASIRISGDASILQPQDLYVDLHWPSGLGVRAGQFKLPVGVDQMTNPEQTKLVNGSLLAAYARPVDVRDVGLSGTWTRDRVGVVLAVIDGNGPNTGDNNDRKDLCGRVAVRPWCGSGIEIGRAHV